MPVTKGAIKKARQDKKRTKVNRVRRENLKKLFKIAQKTKSSSNVRKAISFVDKMAKKHLIHKNKAGRLKSRLSKLAKLAPRKIVKKTK